MNDLVIDVEDELIALLEARAKENGRGLEEEVRQILREALKDDE